MPVAPHLDLFDFSTFQKEPDAFDRSIAATPEIDGFCSSSVWILPAHTAFHGDSLPLVLHGDSGWVALSTFRDHGGGRVLAPLEATWCLACPLAAQGSPEALAAALAGYLRLQPKIWDALFLTGIPVDGQLWRACLHAFSGHRILSGLRHDIRCRASLSGGLDGYLSRRSPRFRKAMRQGLRRGHDAGLEFEYIDRPLVTAERESVFARIMAIEARSWKGLTEQGIGQDPMRRFYCDMLARLARRGDARLLFAVRDGVDLGYLLGGVFGTCFRGLQFSTDHDWAAFSLGNLMQWQILPLLIAEGIAIYDLGMDMEYKKRWSEIEMETSSLIVLRV